MRRVIACVLVFCIIGNIGLFASNEVNPKMALSEFLYEYGYDELALEQQSIETTNRNLDIAGYTLLGVGLSAAIGCFASAILYTALNGHGATNATGGLIYASLGGLALTVASIPLLTINISDACSVSFAVKIATDSLLDNSTM